MESEEQNEQHENGNKGLEEQIPSPEIQIKEESRHEISIVNDEEKIPSQIFAHSYLNIQPMHKKLSFSLIEESKILHDDQEITLKIENYLMKDGFKKHQIYSVKGQDKIGNFEIFRTFKDFLEIRTILMKRWPGCYVPPLPQEKMIGNLNKENVEERSKYIEEFCRKLANLKYLYYSTEFQLFLRGAKNNSELEKIYKGLGEQKYEELIEKYAKIFYDLNGFEINEDLTVKIKCFRETLKGLLAELEKMKKVSKKIADSERDYNASLSVLFNEVLPTYEKKCLTEYLQGEIISNDSYIMGRENDEYLEEFKKILKDNVSNNLFDIFHNLIKKEIKEIQAFLETIAIRDKWEKKRQETISKNKGFQDDLQGLSSGRSTMSNILKLTSKNDNINNLKQNINESIKNIENLQLVVDIINAIIGFIEINKFRAEKRKKYYKLMNLFSNNSSGFHKQLHGAWSYIVLLMEKIEEHNA